MCCHFIQALLLFLAHVELCKAECDVAVTESEKWPAIYRRGHTVVTLDPVRVTGKR